MSLSVEDIFGVKMKGLFGHSCKPDVADFPAQNVLARCQTSIAANRLKQSEVSPCKINNKKEKICGRSTQCITCLLLCYNSVHLQKLTVACFDYLEQIDAI